MLSPNLLVKQAGHFVRSNSPSILSGLGVTGVIATGYLAFNAGYQTARHESEQPPEPSFKNRSLERIKNQWRDYIPPIVAGTVAVTCIIGATRIGNRRTAAITAAYSLSERALVEYKEKVVEKLGERKEQSIRGDIAQDKVKALGSTRDVFLVGSGTVMCMELHTGRIFIADMEKIRRAEVEINDRLIRCDYASLAEFHTLLGISPTQNAGDFGWTHERGLLKLEIDTTLSEDERPVITFGYNYLQTL